MIDGPITDMRFTWPIRPYTKPSRDRAGFLATWWAMFHEVTIDSQGNVVETKVVQGSAMGSEKIEANLRRWHYQPARWTERRLRRGTMFISIPILND